MSEFACSNGHLMRSGQLRCEECGAPLHSMDGVSNAGIRREKALRKMSRRKMEEDQENEVDEISQSDLEAAAEYFDSLKKE